MAVVETFGDDLDERVEVERLEDRVAHRVARDLVHAALAGGGEDDDVRAVAVLAADLLDELVPVQPRHHQVEEDQIVAAVLTQLVQAGRAVFRELDLELHPPQHGLQQNANGEVVVNDENPASCAVESLYWHRLGAAVQTGNCERHTGLERGAGTFDRVRIYVPASK